MDASSHIHAGARTAIAHYHRLIAANLSDAEQQLQHLIGLQRERKILFGDRPLATCLRPSFLTEAVYNDVQDTVYLIRQAVLKIAAAYFNEPRHLEQLGLQDWEIKLAAVPTNVIRLSATARLDAFITPDSFQFVEINAEVPAGPGYMHALAGIYRSLPIFKKFARKYPVRFVSPLEHLVAGLLRIYHEEFDGKADKPAFVIVDHLDVPTVHEFRIIQEYLQRFGFPCEISDPRALECRNGWIYANGRKIDILYRRLLTSELRPIMEECKPYLEGYAAQKTCFLNTFRSKLVHKKAVFAFLTDESYNHVLNPQELQTIRDHIPWTRVLREQTTMFHGLKIDLLEFIRANRRYFVIKPNDEYGGKGVVLGFKATQSEWEAAIASGAGAGFVVQEVVNIHREPFLIQVDSGWQEVPSVLDLDPYLNGPLMGGCLTRVSATDLANVTAGANSLPLFILRYAS